MNHVGQFFSKLSNKMREYGDRARNRLYGRSALKKRREASRTEDASDQSSYSDYKTPAMLASARRMAQRFVKTSASRAASSFRSPSGIPRHRKLNITFCGKKIDWDQISLDGDDDDKNSAGQEFWPEKQNNGAWHLDQLSVKSEWIEESRSSFTSSASGCQTFSTPKQFLLNRLSPQNAFSRTSSLVISKADQTQAPDSPDFSPGQTFDIPYTETLRRRISLPESLKNMLSSTDLSIETNSPNETNSLSEDNWVSLESLELNSDVQAPIFNSSKIDRAVQVNNIEKIDEACFEAKSHSSHDSGLGNGSLLISNDTANNNKYLNITLDGMHDDEKFWKKGRVGISRWYSFENNDDLCLSPLSKAV